MPKIVLPPTIVKLYAQGFLLREIAERFNVHPHTVRERLKEHGTELRSHGVWSTENIRRWRKRTPGYQDGARNPAWRGGTSRSNIRRIAKRVLDAAGIDQYRCQSCNKRSISRMNIHHRNHIRTDNRVQNLEVLCTKCHNSGSPNARHCRPHNKMTGQFM